MHLSGRLVGRRPAPGGRRPAGRQRDRVVEPGDAAWSGQDDALVGADADPVDHRAPVGEPDA
jgi:hypothetical protein